MAKSLINLSATSLDFIIDPRTGAKITWTWGFPLKDLKFYEHMKVELDAPSVHQKYAIYPKQPCECFADDFIMSLNRNLKGMKTEWKDNGEDPGRLSCLHFIKNSDLYEKPDLYYSKLCGINYGCTISPTGAIFTWLYPNGDEWQLSVTALITPLDFPEYDRATATSMALECYEKHYAVLYQHSVSRETLEQWREQARAFLRHTYSWMENPIQVM